jgi:hypothetical protein
MDSGVAGMTKYSVRKPLSQFGQALLQLLCEPFGGRFDGKAGIVQLEEGADARGRPARDLGGEGVEPLLVDRKRPRISGADPRRFVQVPVARSGRGAAGHLLYQSQHLAKLGELGARIGEAGSIERRLLLGHARQRSEGGLRKG